MRVGEYDRKLALGKELLYFAIAVCKYQHSHSRYFVQEHPADASSWNEDSVKEVMFLPGVMVSIFNQCRFGLTSPYSGATVRKQTRNEPSACIMSVPWMPSLDTAFVRVGPPINK